MQSFALWGLRWQTNDRFFPSLPFEPQRVMLFGTQTNAVVVKKKRIDEVLEKPLLQLIANRRQLAFREVLARTTSSTGSDRGGTRVPPIVRSSASTNSTPASAIGCRTVVSGGFEWLAHSMSS